MEWPIMVAMIIAIPVLVIPFAMVWYLDIGGFYRAITASRARRLGRK